MKRTHIKAAFLLPLLLACITGLCQGKLSIDNVYSVTLRNTGSIIENEEVKGYYFFYQSDKIDKNTNEYTLQLMDANLNKLTDFKFKDSKDIFLMESSSNGSALVFMFFDEEQNMIDYRLYNLEGKKTFSYSKPLDKKSEAYFKAAPRMSSNGEAGNESVHDVPNRGFISVVPLREGKNYTYEVNFYSSERRRSWNYNPLEEGKFAEAQYLGANDSIAFLEVLSKPRLLSKEMESTLVGINLHNGRKAFELRTQDKANQLYPMNISFVPGSRDVLVMGPYFQSEERLMQDKSEGIGVWTLDNKGKIVSTKYISWTGDVSKFLKQDFKGRLQNIGYVYFHTLFQTADGKIFAIGEGYNKTASALGITTGVLGAMVGASGGAAMAKMKVTDMVVLELDNKFSLKNATVYDKFNNSVELPRGLGFNNPHTLAMYLKRTGLFDYSFTQMGAGNSTFMSGYTDFEKGKDYKGLTFNSISYYEGKISNDKIQLTTKATRIQVLPAKPGSVLLLEYFKKEKRAELRMEKLN